nr:MAG TPA: hypothetical protein [Bacteriophage sp.]
MMSLKHLRIKQMKRIGHLQERWMLYDLLKDYLALKLLNNRDKHKLDNRRI